MSAIEPSGGYDFVAFDNVGPKTAATPITFYTAKSAGTDYGCLDGVNQRLKVNRIAEYTGGAKIQFDHDIEFSGTTFQLLATTADASDNAKIVICGGGAGSSTRGGFLEIAGNENAAAGAIQLLAGAASASSTCVVGTTTTADFIIKTNSVNRWESDGTAGHFSPLSNNAYDIGSSSFGVRSLYVATSIESLPSVSYSPTISSNSGTYSGTGTTRYMLIGKKLTVFFNVSGTITGSPNYLTVTLPASGFAVDQYFPVRIVNPGGAADELGWFGLPSGSSTLRVYRVNGGTWTAGASASFIGSATFLVA